MIMMEKVASLCFFLFPIVFRKSPNFSNSPSFFMLWPLDRLFGADSTKGRISAGVPVRQRRNTQME